MKIVRCERTKETCDRLEHNMPKELKKLPILLNCGNSKVEDNDDYILINTQSAIKRCLRKRVMFEHIRDYSVDYFDLKSVSRVFRAFVMLQAGGEFVLRKGSRIKCVSTVEDFEKLYKDYSYATLKEEKAFEYRILMFHGDVFKIKVKHNRKNGFVNRQENCRFVDVPIDLFEELYGSGVLEQVRRAVYNLGIHLCGVDLILNDNNEFKILEVNSGAGMCGKSVREFYKILARRFEA